MTRYEMQARKLVADGRSIIELTVRPHVGETVVTQMSLREARELGVNLIELVGEIDGYDRRHKNPAAPPATASDQEE